MPSGGARAHSGPAPDPNALRRERDAGGWITLPAEGPSETPEWPLDGQSEREAVLWARMWRKPQGHMWIHLGLVDEVALYVRQFTIAELPGSPATTVTIVRQLAESLGISVPGLNRNRWKIAASGAAEPRKTA